MSLADIETALRALRAGKPVLVADDENRENEGDVILSAQLATPEWIAWTVRHTSGLLCAPMPDAVADRLELPLMVEHNQDSRQTAYTITVDAARGITTGISAADRALTLQILADPESSPADICRPGHILPLRAVAGGVRERAGHTEAAVELMQLAGLAPVGVIAELVHDNGEMMRMPALLELGARENLPVITIEQLIAYLEAGGAGLAGAGATGGAESAQVPATPVSEPALTRVELVATTNVPTGHGTLQVRVYRDRKLGVEHLALLPVDFDAAQIRDPLVRLHSECLTGEAFDSLKCECGPQLRAALQQVTSENAVVLYLRGQEGRGIGLANKLRAYALQEQGFDTVDANLELGLPADARDYTTAAQILQLLGVQRVRLLTNNPDKVMQLEAYGVAVCERVPLVVDYPAESAEYMQVKRDRMQHLLPESI